MKESSQQFTQRTSLPYSPPPWLQSLGRALGPEEPCPTLFRYPGPEGILEALQGTCARLAPAGLSHVWLSSSPLSAASGATRFGALAVLEPLRLHPCLAPEPNAWLGVNAPLDADWPVVWLPPTALTQSLCFDDIATPDQLRRAYGPSYQAEKDSMTELVSGYLEELDALARAGAPLPSSPWCDAGADERRRLLAAHGVPARYSR